MVKLTRVGFRLGEIAELLRLEDGSHCGEASALAQQKLLDVRGKPADLAHMWTTLSARRRHAREAPGPGFDNHVQ